MNGYHKRVQKAIAMFAERHKENGSLLSSSNGGNTIYVHHPTNKKIAPLIYQPDNIFVMHDRRKMVFQVLGSQIKKKREIEADMIRAFLSPEVSRIVFIVPSKKDVLKISGISTIIQDVLVTYKTDRKSLPLIFTLFVPSRVLRHKRILNYLIKREREIFKHYK